MHQKVPPEPSFLPSIVTMEDDTFLAPVDFFQRLLVILLVADSRGPTQLLGGMTRFKNNPISLRFRKLSYIEICPRYFLR